MHGDTMPKPRWSTVFFMSLIVGFASALSVGRPPMVNSGVARTPAAVQAQPVSDLVAVSDASR
jgi:hypothetical protein